MARNNDRDRDRGPRRPLKDNRLRGKKRVCLFCQERVAWVDYKDVNLLRRFMSDRGKIRSSRVTGNCAQHQREVQVAIKTAREVALLPFTQRTMTERGPTRGPRANREDDGLGARSDSDGSDGVVEDVDDVDSGSAAEGNGRDYVIGATDDPGASRELQESEV
jgi:ribosomal protein S18